MKLGRAVGEAFPFVSGLAPCLHEPMQEPVPSPLTRLCRALLALATGTILACIPWLLVVERNGGDQRPIHLLQSFVAVPLAVVSAAGFLWSVRNDPSVRGWRAAAWLVLLGAGLWLAFLAYVLFLADFSWMDQQ